MGRLIEKAEKIECANGGETLRGSSMKFVTP